MKLNYKLKFSFIFKTSGTKSYREPSVVNHTASWVVYHHSSSAPELAALLIGVYHTHLPCRSLADLNKDGRVDRLEFSIAMKLIKMKLQGQNLPSALPIIMKQPPVPAPSMQIGLGEIYPAFIHS